MIADPSARLGRWLRWRGGVHLSRLGELLGVDWLTYNPLHFYSFHEHAIANAPGVIEAVECMFTMCGRFIDIGAGSGAFAAEVQRRGKCVVALEHNRAGRRLGRSLGVDMRPFDLGKVPPAELNETFDLAYCFEVAEHLPPALGDRLVAFTAALAPIVVFTAAPPGQTGTGHINEQPQSYWIERFRLNGMEYRRDLSEKLSAGFEERRVAPWFTRNAMVFVRRGHSSVYADDV